MASLLFNFFSWYWGCRPQLLLFFLRIIIFLIFLLFLCVFFNIFESLCWQKKIKKLFERQEKILKKMLPLIDLGKITLFSINTLKNPLTILRIILDKFKDPDLIKDDKKFKKYFNTKAKMIKSDEVEDLTGHPVGGVCPFGVKENVEIFLDESIRDFKYVYPAAGSRTTALKIEPDKIEELTDAIWIDVCTY